MRNITWKRSSYSLAASLPLTARPEIGAAGPETSKSTLTGTWNKRDRRSQIETQPTHSRFAFAASREGDEVVQLYISGGTGDDAAIRNLRGFQRIHLRAGESRQVTFRVDAADLPKSTAEVSVGGGQPVGSTPHVKGSL